MYYLEHFDYVTLICPPLLSTPCSQILKQYWTTELPLPGLESFLRNRNTQGATLFYARFCETDNSELVSSPAAAVMIFEGRLLSTVNYDFYSNRRKVSGYRMQPLVHTRCDLLIVYPLLVKLSKIFRVALGRSTDADALCPVFFLLNKSTYFTIEWCAFWLRSPCLSLPVQAVTDRITILSYFRICVLSRAFSSFFPLILVDQTQHRRTEGARQSKTT